MVGLPTVQRAGTTRGGCRILKNNLRPSLRVTREIATVQRTRLWVLRNMNSNISQFMWSCRLGKSREMAWKWHKYFRWLRYISNSTRCHSRMIDETMQGPEDVHHNIDGAEHVKLVPGHSLLESLCVFDGASYPFLRLDHKKLIMDVKWKSGWENPKGCDWCQMI